MLYRFGTKDELCKLSMPMYLKEKLSEYIDTLDDAYGENRDYYTRGGYVMLAETSEDILKAKTTVDYHSLLFEWVDRIGNDYVATLYMLGDDYSIVLCTPINIAPQNIINELRGVM